MSDQSQIDALWRALWRERRDRAEKDALLRDRIERLEQVVSHPLILIAELEQKVGGR
jgi:hypothetical protein